MYTIDDENNNKYEEEQYNNDFWYNNKGLIVKIIIIILCIIVLIWLFKALSTKKDTVDDSSIRSANIEKVRLAAENYFFIKNNKKDNETVSLSNLRTQGYTSEVIDSNNKTCDENMSTVNLVPTSDSYKMTVNLVCANSNDKQEFLYDNKTLTCLNCNGKTLMNGTLPDNVSKDDVAVDNNSNYSNEYSCVEWSTWTKNRVNESYLEERSKTLVQGVKYANTTKRTKYGEWSEYTETPIQSSNELEVETTNVKVNNWSEAKTSTSIDPNSSNIRILSTEVKETTTNNCSKGFVVDNKCYSNKVYTSNLSMQEYVSGNYYIRNGRCESVKTLKNSNGEYVLTYVNCQYNKLLNNNATSSSSYTIYTYQELIQTTKTYYRSRTVEVCEIKDGKDIYTTDKYEEKDLPAGYVKVNGTEETYYSYKLHTCVK